MKIFVDLKWILLLRLSQVLQGFFVDVGAGEMECFILPAPAKSTVAGNFEVVTEGAPLAPVTVIVRDLNDRISEPKYESLAESGGLFSFDVSTPSEYELCLGNGSDVVDDGMIRTFGFAFRLEGSNENVIIIEGQSDESSKKIEDVIDAGRDLVEDLFNMVDHQSYMRQREELHKETIESTNRRVLSWTVAEALLLVFMAYWQVGYIRKFFEVKRML